MILAEQNRKIILESTYGLEPGRELNVAKCVESRSKPEPGQESAPPGLGFHVFPLPHGLG